MRTQKKENSFKFTPARYISVKSKENHNKAKFNKVCDILDWKEDSFKKLAGEILSQNPEQEIPIHRKVWEFTKTIQAIEDEGLLNENSIGLSVAAGNERILYYLANKIKLIVASDIYGEGDFSNLEAESSFLKNPKQFAPYEYKEDALLPVYMDGLNLKFEDNLFDFAFCMSSIEHFGGVKNAKKAVDEMIRVVKPGGIVCFTTELSLNGYKTDEMFLPREMDKITNNSSAKLVSKMDYSISEESLTYLVDMLSGDINKLPHLNLKLLCSAFTSICVVLKKDEDGSSLSIDEKLDKVTQTINKYSQQDLNESSNSVNALKPIKQLFNKVKKIVLVRYWKLQELLFWK